MLYVKPDYYDSFRCIAEKCTHNCCIGWEIDIDSDALDFYLSLNSKFGERLRDNIDALDDPAHFILQKDDRCPLLNGNNLCEIITVCGEEHLCTICREHPRFHNELPYRTESGLGLCCEESARIILAKQTPFRLITSGREEYPDSIVLLRDRAIDILKDRSFSIDDRINRMMKLLKINTDIKIDTKWLDFFKNLERLDPVWTGYLDMLTAEPDSTDPEDFGRYMSDRQCEYEQLLIYFIYRHLANADSRSGAGIRGLFSVLAYKMIFTLGAMIYSKNGSFTFEDQVELARLFSSEIEYSLDNFDAVLLKLEESCEQQNDPAYKINTE